MVHGAEGTFIHFLAMDLKNKTIGLALGSGGARGYAHIGVIEELERRGAKIVAIAGSSMGAAVGGIYSAGKLNEFKDWSTKLTRMETMRLMDFTFSGQGVIKGERVVNTLRELLGDSQIEDFSMDYTAVATDFKTNTEVWMNTGNLFEVIRASSGVPTLMTPIISGNKILVDGGVLNPLPLNVLKGKKFDLTVAVNINAPGFLDSDGNDLSQKQQNEKPTQEDTEAEVKGYKERFTHTMKSWLNMTKSTTPKNAEESLGYLGLLNRSYDLMQDQICLMSIDLHRPEVVVSIPRRIASTLEMYRAEDMIEEGIKAAKKAIDIALQDEHK